MEPMLSQEMVRDHSHEFAISFVCPQLHQASHSGHFSVHFFEEKQKLFIINVRGKIRHDAPLYNGPILFDKFD